MQKAKVGKALAMVAFSAVVFATGAVYGAAKENHLENALGFLTKASEELGKSGSKSANLDNAIKLTNDAMGEVRAAIRAYEQRH